MSNSKERKLMKIQTFVVGMCLLFAGCGAKTPSEVVKAWACANEDGDAEDVMYYSYQDQMKPRIDLNREAQVFEFEKSHKKYELKFWEGFEDGDVLREYVKGSHAWVMVKSNGNVLTYELALHEDKWKVLDPSYDAQAVVNDAQ